MKDKCGNLITEGLARRERWKEHFEEILNRHNPIDPVTDVEIDPIINEISTDPITKAEIRTSLRMEWNFTSKLEDRDFADDIALMSSCYTHIQTKTR